MNRRTAALLSSVVVSSLALTACGSIGSNKTNALAHGMVVEREQELNRSGDKVYELTLTTDRKSIRRHKNRGKKLKEITVSASVWKDCDLKEMYPACK